MAEVLADMQERFREALLDPETCKEQGSFATRFSIYQRNVRESLTATLATHFPVVEQLVGERFFRSMAWAYITRCPPGEGCLQDYGDDFAYFIAGYDAASSLPYLPDVARLEWACHRAYWAEDAEMLTPQALQDIPEAHYPLLQLPLHGSASLLHSRFAPYRIWQAHQEEGGEVNGLTIDGPEYLLVWRDKLLNINIINLAEPEYLFLKALAEHLPLEKAVEAGISKQRDTDIQGWLSRHITGGVFAAFTMV